MRILLYIENWVFQDLKCNLINESMYFRCCNHWDIASLFAKNSIQVRFAAPSISTILLLWIVARFSKMLTRVYMTYMPIILNFLILQCTSVQVVIVSLLLSPYSYPGLMLYDTMWLKNSEIFFIVALKTFIIHRIKYQKYLTSPRCVPSSIAQ